MAREPSPAPDALAPLNRWLGWLEQLHPVEIELGLERIAEVAARAGLRETSMPVVTVAGTNGKGSTVAMLSAIYRHAGYRTGHYTSPHIEHFNERICIQGEPVGDAAIVAALQSIESVRLDETLTYYEYTTLAAMRLFEQAGCEVVVLEVGLGGRLDATNLWDADCAIVTSIALDHQAWLGNSRSEIGLEKVAIGRAGRPMIIGDADPPPSMIDQARQAGMQLVLPDARSVQAPPALSGAHQQRNTACALAAVAALQARLPVTASLAAEALNQVQVAGRMERKVIKGRRVLLDVAHNPAAASALASALADQYAGQPIDIIFATLADKDAAGVAAALLPVVRHWHCVQLTAPRATPVASLKYTVEELIAARCPAEQSYTHVFAHPTAAAAWQAAIGATPGQQAASEARGTPPSASCCASVVASDAPLILITGSFFTLGEILALWTRDDGKQAE